MVLNMTVLVYKDREMLGMYFWATVVVGIFRGHTIDIFLSHSSC